MASGRFSKQALPFLEARYLNSGTGSATPGGTITAAPSGLTVSQFQQNIPGDRIILSPVDALALSNNAVGNLYTGTFRYVGTRNNSTSGPVRGCAAVWDPLATAAASSAASDALYQVTSDCNNGAYSNTLFAGVFINAITKGNWGWIQESGKASCKFIATITAPTPTTNCGVYLPITPSANNNATDNGAFDQLVGANSAAIFQANSTTGYTTVEQMIMKYVGVAELIPSNNNVSLVDITLSRASFRW
jgi:hypothetical protein